MIFNKRKNKNLDCFTGVRNDFSCAKHTKTNLSTYRLNVLKTDNTPHPSPLPQGAREKRAAFTLAEVLITLGIIGVVAALVIPSVIENYQKQVTAESIKKMYSATLQAVDMYQAKNGIAFSEFDFTLNASDFLQEYFRPYMNVIGECDSTLKCYKQYPIGISRQIYNQVRPAPIYVLADGSYFGVSWSSTNPDSNPGKVLFYDINGAKGPNYAGRDIFFSFLNKAGIYPGGFSGYYKPFTLYKRDELLGTTVDRSCNRKAGGVGYGVSGDACMAVIMMDGWKIKKDYPW